jgi:fatty acid desaturase
MSVAAGYPRPDEENGMPNNDAIKNPRGVWWWFYGLIGCGVLWLDSSGWFWVLMPIVAVTALRLSWLLNAEPPNKRARKQEAA